MSNSFSTVLGPDEWQLIAAQLGDAKDVARLTRLCRVTTSCLKMWLTQTPSDMWIEQLFTCAQDFEMIKHRFPMTEEQKERIQLILDTKDVVARSRKISGSIFEERMPVRIKNKPLTMTWNSVVVCAGNEIPSWQRAV